MTVHRLLNGMQPLRIARKPFRLPKLAGAGSGADAFGMMRCFAKRFTLGRA